MKSRTQNIIVWGHERSGIVCRTMDKIVEGDADGGDVKKEKGDVMGVERDKCFLICTNEKDALSLRLQVG